MSSEQGALLTGERAALARALHDFGKRWQIEFAPGARVWMAVWRPPPPWVLEMRAAFTLKVLRAELEKAEDSRDCAGGIPRTSGFFD